MILVQTLIQYPNIMSLYMSDTLYSGKIWWGRIRQMIVNFPTTTNDFIWVKKTGGNQSIKVLIVEVLCMFYFPIKLLRYLMLCLTYVFHLVTFGCYVMLYTNVLWNGHHEDFHDLQNCQFYLWKFLRVTGESLEMCKFHGYIFNHCLQPFVIA